MSYQTAWADIAKERIRQQTDEGFGDERDDKYVLNELPRAAEAYRQRDPSLWPWGSWTFKLGNRDNRRKNLIKAGALYLAEADRLVRQANRMKVLARQCADEAAELANTEV